jgi:hypothetical protein
MIHTDQDVNKYYSRIGVYSLLFVRENYFESIIVTIDDEEVKKLDKLETIFWKTISTVSAGFCVSAVILCP